MTHSYRPDQTAFTLAHAAQQRAIRARQRRQRRLAQQNNSILLTTSSLPPTRSPSQQTGDRYEALAWEYLRQAGCTLLGKQLQSPVGELDLVVREAQTLVFVEVRYRASQQFGGAIASLSQTKQTRLLKVIQWWLPKIVHAAFAGKMPFCRVDFVTFEQDTLRWHQDVMCLRQDK